MVQSWTASSALGASMTDLSPGKTSWMGGGREGLSELMVVLVVLCSLAKKGPVPSPLSGRRASLLDFCEQIYSCCKQTTTQEWSQRSVVSQTYSIHIMCGSKG